jgi:acyl-CoA synthetase (AMP-forming)/AMP-acid ligase II
MTGFHSIPEAIRHYAHDTPDKVCLIEGGNGTKVTYGEFWREIRRFAEMLKSKGFVGGNVLMKTAQKIEHLIAFYGIQIADGVAIPAEGSASVQMLNDMAAQFDARFIVAPRLIETGLEIIPHGAQRETAIDPVDEALSIDENALAVIICTTGTTGKSKGVLSSYKCRFAGADNVSDTYGITANDVALIPQVLSHSGGLRRVEAMLISGATTVIMGAQMFFGGIFDAIQDYGVSVFQLVPAQAAQLLTSAEKRFAEVCADLRIISVGSAVIPEAHKERLRELFPRTRLFNDFGSTEAIGSAYFEWSKYPPKTSCVGIEAVHSKIVFLDGNGAIMTDTSAENPGTIATEGDTLMSGYYGDDELTASVMQNGRVLSSDFGYRSDDGLIYIVGRKTDIIVSGANKISPAEIEEYVAALDGISECALVGKPDKIMGSVPVLFIVPENPAEFNARDLTAKMGDKFENFKIPKPDNVIVIERLPRTNGTGKIIKKELCELL